MRTRSPLLRRLPVLAALALVGLSACGDPDDNSSAATTPATSPATGAPTTTGGTDTPNTGELRAPTPIEYAAGSGGTAGSSAGGALAAPTAEVAADDRMATDMMWTPTYIAEFLVGEQLPPLPTHSTGWVYAGPGTGSAELAAEMAAAFGVTGEVVRVDDWEPGGWQVGPTDGSADSFFLSDDAQLTWSFSPAWTDTPYVAACAMEGVEDVAPDASFAEEATAETIAVDECIPETVPAPVGVPTADEAEARARELLASLGVDPDAVVYDTYADDWSASVTATVPIEGLAEGASDGRSWYFGFGAEGALAWAGGAAATPEAVGPYELIDLDTALARLRESAYGFGMPVDLLRTGAAETTEVAPDTPVADDTATLSAPADSFPVGTLPEPEPITVTLVDVQADLWWVWGTDGEVWVLPAYRFIGDDGGWYTVPAVGDEYLVEVEPTVIEPVISDPAVDPAPDTTGSAGDAGDTGDTGDTSEEVSVAGLDELIGATIDDFTAAAEAEGLTVRVTEIDGESQPVTMDYRTDRVNVAVVTGEDGTQTVTAIVDIG